VRSEQLLAEQLLKLLNRKHIILLDDYQYKFLIEINELLIQVCAKLTRKKI